MVVEGFPWEGRLWKLKGGELGRRWAVGYPGMGVRVTCDECCTALFDDDMDEGEMWKLSRGIWDLVE